jgi:glycerol-3-phosphate dehydrogenase subunit B
VIRKSLEFFADRVAEEGITLNHNGDNNHFHVTAIGAVKPTYLSQESVYSSRGKEIIKSGAKIAILNFKGFRDYYPEQTAANLKNHPLFKRVNLYWGTFHCPTISTQRRTCMNSGQLI